MTEKTPKVSVVVPVYNVGDWLAQCLNSLVNQTLRDIEIICVDDGSSDASPEILARYAANDPRIRIVRQSNSGAAAARNHGIEAARGDYLFFCDPDDWCERDLLARAFGRARALDCDLVLFGVFRHDRTCPVPYAKYISRKIGRFGRTFSGRDAADHIFVHGLANPWNKLFKRSYVEARKLRFQDLRRENDLYFSYAGAALASRISIVGEALYHYRFGREGSLQFDGIHDGQPLLWTSAFLAVKRRLDAEGLLGVFALGLLRALIGTGARATVKVAGNDDIRRHYAVLRRETEEFARRCSGRLGELSALERNVLGIVTENDSPLPLAAFFARRFKARADMHPDPGITALSRRLERAARRLRVRAFWK